MVGHVELASLAVWEHDGELRTGRQGPFVVPAAGRVGELVADHGDRGGVGDAAPAWCTAARVAISTASKSQPPCLRRAAKSTPNSLSTSWRTCCRMAAAVFFTAVVEGDLITRRAGGGR